MICNICNQNSDETISHDNQILCKDCFNAKQTLKHLHQEIEEGEDIPECETCGFTTTIAVSWGCYCGALCDYHYTTETHDANLEERLGKALEEEDTELMTSSDLGDCELCNKPFDSGEYCKTIHNHCLEDDIVCCRCWCAANPKFHCPDAWKYNEEEE